MKTYIQGLITGFLLCSTAILLMGAGDDKVKAGRYEYYISTDDITKKHYSRIFDTNLIELIKSKIHKIKKTR